MSILKINRHSELCVQSKFMMKLLVVYCRLQLLTSHQNENMGE